MLNKPGSQGKSGKAVYLVRRYDYIVLFEFFRGHTAT